MQTKCKAGIIADLRSAVHVLISPYESWNFSTWANGSRGEVHNVMRLLSLPESVWVEDILHIKQKYSVLKKNSMRCIRGVWKKRNKGTCVRFQAVSQSVQFSNKGKLCVIYLPGCHMCSTDKSLLYRQRHKQRKGLIALWYLFLVFQTLWKELDVL